MQRVNTVIFDLGRVLVTIDPSGEKFTRLMQALGIRPEQAFSRFWFVPEVRRHMTGHMTTGQFYDFVRGHLGDEEFTYDAFVEAWADLFHPLPGMEALFRDVSARHAVGILSDTDPVHWEKVKSLLPWLARVEKPTLSYQVGYLKPHPVMYTTAAENCGRNCDQCLFIDDRQENIDGARMNHMPGIRFTGAEKLRKDLAAFGLL